LRDRTKEEIKDESNVNKKRWNAYDPNNNYDFATQTSSSFKLK
jgi:hypothetical protein